MYAQIAFQQKIGDQEFLTYKIPENLLPILKIGQLVEFPLRKNPKTGLVWQIISTEPSFKTSEISKILNEEPLLTPLQIELVNFIKDYYFTPLFKVLKFFIPSKIFKGKEMRLNKKTKKEVKLPTKKEFSRLSPDQQKAFDTIINSIEQKNSTQTGENTTSSPPSLNKFLIHGITGSGKTEIYIHLARYFLDKGQQVLILVPEISLTPQTVEYFESRIQIKAAVIHSRLSEGEKFKAWKDIKSNQKPLVIGSRSAIFAPFTNLGIIIIDEEHELSYKQDQAPRYLTHTIAEKIQQIAENSFPPRIIPLILGSATPSIETAYNYRDSTIYLRERIGTATLPDIKIVDMREEFRKGNKSIFSDTLMDELNKTLAGGNQAILFLNRRGSASSIVCRDCGYKLTCPNCDIPMTYHAKTLGTPVVICHHCGQIGKIPINCPNCKGPNIRFLGIGTERIEEDTKKLFKNARIARADRDTTSRKTSFEQIYSSFKKGDVDILIGTQMIAKGLHIPNVNLVGVILADIGLNMPDFRTSERNFQLLTQVAGRAGRSEEKGTVIIQTYTPDHAALIAAKDHDYNSFYQMEKSQRGILRYPPFIKMAKLSIENKIFLKAKKEAEDLETILKKTLSANPNIQKEITETTVYPAFIIRLHSKYRYRILIKGENPSKLLKLIDPKLLENVKIDIDPISTN